jgi:hypothetical protein
VHVFVLLLDERELDIPNGENNAENEEEQEQPEVEEQEFYVEGLYRAVTSSRSAFFFLLSTSFFVLFLFQLHVELFVFTSHPHYRNCTITSRGECLC